MAESPNPLSGDVWRRGSRLGLIWLAVFVVVTAAIYALLAVVGWSGTLRALCAMGAGPVLGSAAIAAWWVIRRPALGSGDDAGDDSYEGKP
jgi:hypothetical protein